MLQRRERAAILDSIKMAALGIWPMWLAMVLGILLTTSDASAAESLYRCQSAIKAPVEAVVLCVRTAGDQPPRDSSQLIPLGGSPQRCSSNTDETTDFAASLTEKAALRTALEFRSTERSDRIARAGIRNHEWRPRRSVSLSEPRTRVTSPLRGGRNSKRRRKAMRANFGRGAPAEIQPPEPRSGSASRASTSPPGGGYDACRRLGEKTRP